MSIKTSPFEVLHVNSKKVSCEGGKGASSHPLVYLNMGEKDHVICPYCSKYFTTNKSNSQEFSVSYDKNKKNS